MLNCILSGWSYEPHMDNMADVPLADTAQRLAVLLRGYLKAGKDWEGKLGQEAEALRRPCRGHFLMTHQRAKALKWCWQSASCQVELAESSQSKIKKAWNWRAKRGGRAGGREKRRQSLIAQETIRAMLSCRAASAQISWSAILYGPAARQVFVSSLEWEVAINQTWAIVMDDWKGEMHYSSENPLSRTIMSRYWGHYYCKPGIV